MTTLSFTRKLIPEKNEGIMRLVIFSSYYSSLDFLLDGKIVFTLFDLGTSVSGYVMVPKEMVSFVYKASQLYVSRDEVEEKSRQCEENKTISLENRHFSIFSKGSLP